MSDSGSDSSIDYTTIDYAPDLFNVSDITVPTSTLEGWRALANQLQPSKGAGSGGFMQGKSANDAQYLRRFNLTVYGGASGAPQGGPATQGGSGSLEALGAGLIGSQTSPQLQGQGANPGVPTAAQQRSRAHGIDLSSLRCSFTIDKNTNRSPNKLYARVYNMAPATMGRVIEMGRVQIEAGYWFSNYGTVFNGVVTQYVRGKENPTDTFLDIYAGDGDKAIGSPTITQKFTKGQTHADLFQALNKAQQARDPNLRIGEVAKAVANMKKVVFTKEYIAHGDVARISRQLEMAHGFDTFIDNGTLHAVNRSEYLPGEALVLNPRSGLISIPEITPQGVQIKCLLNPKLRLGGLVKVDTKLLSGVHFVPGTSAEMDSKGNVVGPGQAAQHAIPQTARNEKPATFAFTSPTGTYKIILMKIIGDTRGLPWYCDMACLAVGSDGKLIPPEGPSVLRRYYGGTVPVGGEGPTTERTLANQPLPAGATPPT